PAPRPRRHADRRGPAAGRRGLGRGVGPGSGRAVAGPGRRSPATAHQHPALAGPQLAAAAAAALPVRASGTAHQPGHRHGAGPLRGRRPGPGDPPRPGPLAGPQGAAPDGRRAVPGGGAVAARHRGHRRRTRPAVVPAAVGPRPAGLAGLVPRRRPARTEAAGDAHVQRQHRRHARRRGRHRHRPGPEAHRRALAAAGRTAAPAGTRAQDPLRVLHRPSRPPPTARGGGGVHRLAAGGGPGRGARAGSRIALAKAASAARFVFRLAAKSSRLPPLLPASREPTRRPLTLTLTLPLPLMLMLTLPLILTSGAPPERRGRRTRPRRGAAQGCAAFSAEAGCLLGKSRRLRGPGAKHRARRRGVLSLRQVSLHKQRKVARAVTARKLLILMSAEERRVKTRPTGLRRNSRRVKTRPTRLRGDSRRVKTRPTGLWRNGRRVKTRPTGLRLLFCRQEETKGSSLRSPRIVVPSRSAPHGAPSRPTSARGGRGCGGQKLAPSTCETFSADRSTSGRQRTLTATIFAPVRGSAPSLNGAMPQVGQKWCARCSLLKR